MPVAEPPNHHADLPGFSGIPGFLAGLAMLAGRGKVARLAADLAEISDTDRVVDIGCGPGAAVREAARRGAEVWGVDPAPVMLRIARGFTGRDAGISWLAGTAEGLPLPDGAATVTWSISTVHHWKDLDHGLAEVFRVLVPGGRLLAIERRREAGTSGLASHGWTDDQAQAFADYCVAKGLNNPHILTKQIGRTAHLIVKVTRAG